jgi:hypothetical protein
VGYLSHCFRRYPAVPYLERRGAIDKLVTIIFSYLYL